MNLPSLFRNDALSHRRRSASLPLSIRRVGKLRNFILVITVTWLLLISPPNGIGALASPLSIPLPTHLALVGPGSELLHHQPRAVGLPAAFIPDATQMLHIRGGTIATPSPQAAALDAATADDSTNTRSPTFVVFAILIPVLVILSGIFAGLTLGYMSLDETQLSVLSISGSPKQQEYARKIMPIRQNGHLLLTTLLLANMIVNESLPVISDQVLGGGVQAVVVSTVLIVIFAEIIPQSVCSRYGLVVGAKMAVPVRILIWALAIIAWPVAKILEWVLGPHHGIIYRRAELKELINMHAAYGSHGGDLVSDTITIVGGALDLQVKTAKEAMTPIEDVFMLPIDAKLDYETLAMVVRSGHSRVPVFEEVEIPVLAAGGKEKRKVKRIKGILLVKQCVLLDPEDATPLRDIPLNNVPTVPYDEPLLEIINRFQSGRSHMAIVSKFPKGKEGSVKSAVKQGLTKRFLKKLSSNDSSDEDIERGEGGKKTENGSKVNLRIFGSAGGGLEQTMPADAVLANEAADKFLEGIEFGPLGIITLEDVLEELIGEEIYDEFDLRGAQALPASTYVPPEAQRAVALADTKRRLKKQLLSAGTSSVPTTPVPLDSPTLNPPPTQTTSITSKLSMGLQLPHKVAKALKFERSRSVPGRIRDESPSERSSIIPTSTPPEPSTTPETSALRPDGLPALSANTMPGMTMPVKSSSAPPAAVVAMEAESKEDLDLHHFNNSSITIKEDDDSPLVPITLSTPKGSPHPVHDILPPIEGAATPTTPAQAKVSLPLSRGPSRSGSPVPSLLNEAILIERGRRAVETGSNGASKGRFKSSPLVGVRLTPPPNLLNTTEASSEPSSKTNEDE